MELPHFSMWTYIFTLNTKTLGNGYLEMSWEWLSDFLTLSLIIEESLLFETMISNFSHSSIDYFDQKSQTYGLHFYWVTLYNTKFHKAS